MWYTNRRKSRNFYFDHAKRREVETFTVFQKSDNSS